MYGRGAFGGNLLNCAVLETLESRRLLSVPVAAEASAPAPTLSNGLLAVTGTAGDDNIRISIANDTSKLAVKVNGQATLFSLAAITKIKVDGLAGNDEICIKQS